VNPQKSPGQKCVKAIHHSGDEHFHLGLINAENLVPRDSAAIGVNGSDVGIIAGASDRGDPG
jgi:hypothetical protein